MAETHDTIDSLLAEFRGYAAGMPASYHVTMSWHDFRKMLDRLEAAHDHDVDTATDAASRSVVGACVKLQERSASATRCLTRWSASATGAHRIWPRTHT